MRSCLAGWFQAFFFSKRKHIEALLVVQTFWSSLVFCVAQTTFGALISLFAHVISLLLLVSPSFLVFHYSSFCISLSLLLSLSPSWKSLLCTGKPSPVTDLIFNEPAEEFRWRPGQSHPRINYYRLTATITGTNIRQERSFTTIASKTSIGLDRICPSLRNMICYGAVDTAANIQLSVAAENDIGQGIKNVHSHPGKKGRKKKKKKLVGNYFRSCLMHDRPRFRNRWWQRICLRFLFCLWLTNEKQNSRGQSLIKRNSLHNLHFDFNFESGCLKCY